MPEPMTAIFRGAAEEGWEFISGSYSSLVKAGERERRRKG